MLSAIVLCIRYSLTQQCGHMERACLEDPPSRNYPGYTKEWLKASSRSLQGQDGTETREQPVRRIAMPCHGKSAVSTSSIQTTTACRDWFLSSQCLRRLDVANLLRASPRSGSFASPLESQTGPSAAIKYEGTTPRSLRAVRTTHLISQQLRFPHRAVAPGPGWA